MASYNPAIRRDMVEIRDAMRAAKLQFSGEYKQIWCVITSHSQQYLKRREKLGITDRIKDRHRSALMLVASDMLPWCFTSFQGPAVCTATINLDRQRGALDTQLETIDQERVPATDPLNKSQTSSVQGRGQVATSHLEKASRNAAKSLDAKIFTDAEKAHAKLEDSLQLLNRNIAFAFSRSVQDLFIDIAQGVYRGTVRAGIGLDARVRLSNIEAKTNTGTVLRERNTQFEGLAYPNRMPTVALKNGLAKTPALVEIRSYSLFKFLGFWT